MNAEFARFAAAQAQTDRQAFNRFLASKGLNVADAVSKERAKQEFMSLTPLLDDGVAGVAHQALAGAVGPPVTSITSTVWKRVDMTHGGIPCVGTWAEYGAWHLMLAQAVAAKGEGIAYSPSVNRDGHRCNASTVQMTALILDDDGTGDWFTLWAVLMSLGLAALGHRSGGHREGLPKWRMVFPLAAPFDTSTPESVLAWRSAYASARTVFGALAGLVGPGFDPATDGPHHPWYPGSRRSLADSPREVLQTHGATLNLAALLARLPPPLLHQGAVQREVGLSHSGLPPRGPLPASLEGDQAASLLELAFSEAGMLGRRLREGKLAVICPWNQSHTTPLPSGLEASSSTIIWPSTSAANLGGFSCAHSCGSPSVELVLDALPSDAVWRARQRHIGADRPGARFSPRIEIDPRLPLLPVHLNGLGH